MIHASYDAIGTAEEKMNIMASRNKTLPQVSLGSVGEFRIYGLTLPGLEDLWDPQAPACLPAGTALKLLLRIFETLWKLDKDTQARLLKVSPSSLGRYRRGLSVPRRQEQLQRIGDLLRCYMILRALFPHKPKAAENWFTHANPRFRPNPVGHMMRHGTRGVLLYLHGRLG